MISSLRNEVIVQWISVLRDELPAKGDQYVAVELYTYQRIPISC
jgi:hypothetical protein